MVLLVGAGATLRADTVDLPITLEISALIDGRDQLIHLREFAVQQIPDAVLRRENGLQQ